MRQRGVTLIELVICIGVLGIIASMAVLTLGQSLAKQELDSTSRQLVADIRWLQQLSINTGGGTVIYRLLFNNSVPYGYYVTANTQVIKKVTLPVSIRLGGNYIQIGFGLSGAPTGAQTISLQSTKLKTWKYVVLAPVTGRVRISDVVPGQTEE